MTVEARRIVVRGRVQGVGFRYFVQECGNSRGLTGDVRNCADRTVEIEVEGPAPDVEAFIEEVRRGPQLARVDGLDIQPLPAGLGYKYFMIEGY